MGDNSVIENCTARFNDVMGIRALSHSSVISCSSSHNDQSGFQVDGTLIGCSASENDGNGFTLWIKNEEVFDLISELLVKQPARKARY